jgi:hypothetical protein
MSTVTGGPGNIVTNGLVLNLDAANPRSYPQPYNGTTWFDISGNNSNGTFINGPTFNSGNGGSIVFDGVNDSTNFGNILNLGTNSCTINQWIKMTSTPVSFVCTLSKAFFGAQDYRYAILINPSRQITPFISGNTGDISPSTVFALTLNVWYMVTCIFDRTSSIKVYINGLQTLTGTAIISQLSNLNFQSINPFRVGSYTFSDNTSPNLFFPGSIASTQMYFRVLSDLEVLQNFNATRARFGI